MQTGCGRARERALQQRQAVHARHAHVAEHDVHAARPPADPSARCAVLGEQRRRSRRCSARASPSRVFFSSSTIRMTGLLLHAAPLPASAAVGARCAFSRRMRRSSRGRTSVNVRAARAARCAPRSGRRGRARCAARSSGPSRSPPAWWCGTARRCWPSSSGGMPGPVSWNDDRHEPVRAGQRDAQHARRPAWPGWRSG